MLFRSVRANLIPANGLEQTLTILPRTSVTTAFRLVRSGSLSGRVWNDANANGKYDTGEGMADIRIVASSGRDTYTDPDGSFLLTELPPGDQNVFIDERYKPEDFIIPASSLRVTVESGKETHGVQFLFAVKSRGVKEIDFGTKAAPALSPNAAGRPKTKTREK